MAGPDEFQDFGDQLNQLMMGNMEDMVAQAGMAGLVQKEALESEVALAEMGVQTAEAEVTAAEAVLTARQLALAGAKKALEIRKQALDNFTDPTDTAMGMLGRIKKFQSDTEEGDGPV